VKEAILFCSRDKRTQILYFQCLWTETENHALLRGSSFQSTAFQSAFSIRVITKFLIPTITLFVLWCFPTW